MKAPILSAAFKWIPASTHSTSEAFAARQRQRMADAQPRTALTRKLELRQIVGKRNG